MGSRFLVSLLATFVLTVVALAGAGYAVTQFGVRTPRDPFRAGAFEFDLAPGWWCERDGTEFVCTPPGEAPHAAIAVIAVKERNRNDNLAAYEKHLRTPQGGADGASPPSQISYVRRIRLGHAEWVEALHLGSELPNFHTYYLATNTSSLGILVTLSVHKDREATYVSQMTDMMRTLSVYQR